MAVRITKFIQRRHVDGVRAFSFCGPSAIVMVVVPNHLTLVERNVYLAVNSGERVAIQSCTKFYQLGISPEKMALRAYCVAVGRMVVYRSSSMVKCSARMG